MSRRLGALALGLAGALTLAAGAARADTILFVGNSFTFGFNSAAWKYRADSVTDLNGEGIGGVPALFKLFTQEAGLNYQVSLETHPGVGLDWHWANRLAKIDHAWDHVVLQSFSTLDATHPGDPALLTDYAARFAQRLRARNPKVDIRLDATWSRPDVTFQGASPWRSKSIFAMADDLSCGYRAAARPAGAAVIETGEAFSRAIRDRLSPADPYDGTPFGQVDLWSFDNYHASVYGYYLEALMMFGSVTGVDPTRLGPDETAAKELGLSAREASALESVAYEQLTSAPPACGGA